MALGLSLYNKQTNSEIWAGEGSFRDQQNMYENGYENTAALEHLSYGYGVCPVFSLTF